MAMFVSPNFPISLTRKGYPRIIPVFHRKKIYRGTAESHRLVRLYLTIFSIGRIIKLAKPVNKGTYSSIIFPPRDMDSIQSMVSDIKCVLPRRYIPTLAKIPRVDLGCSLKGLPKFNIPQVPFLHDL